MTDGYITDDDIRRNPDGTYTVTAGNGRHHFDTADQAMAYYAGIVRRVAAIEQAAQKAADVKRKTAK